MASFGDESTAEESKFSEPPLQVAAKKKDIGPLLNELSREMLKFSEEDKKNTEELLKSIEGHIAEPKLAEPKKGVLSQVSNTFKQLDSQIGNRVKKLAISQKVNLQIPKENVDPNMGTYPALLLTDESYENLINPDKEKLKSIYMYYFFYLLNKYVILAMMQNVKKDIINENIKEIKKFIEHEAFTSISTQFKSLFIQICKQLEQVSLNPFTKEVIEGIVKQIQALEL